MDMYRHTYYITCICIYPCGTSVYGRGRCIVGLIDMSKVYIPDSK